MKARIRLLLTAGGVCGVVISFAVLGILRSQRVAESVESSSSSGLPSIGGSFQSVESSSSSGLPSIGGSFQLIDKEGKTWKDTDFHGKPFLVYFGYTYCPDICPTALYAMSQAVEKLGGASVIQPLFITIDPQRDTPSQLQSYTQKFLKDFILLTGSETEINKAVRAYRVHAARVQDEGVETSRTANQNEPYLMDHSSLIYLMGKNGAYIAHFNHQSDPAEITDRVTHYLKTGQ